MSVADLVFANLYVQGLPVGAYIAVLVALVKTIRTSEWARPVAFGAFCAGALGFYPVALLTHWLCIRVFTSIDTEFAGFGFAMFGNMILLAAAFIVALPFAFRALRQWPR
jgi:hypothetical protein